MASMQQSHGQYFAVYRDRESKRQVWLPLGHNLRTARRRMFDVEDMLQAGIDPLIETSTFRRVWAERIQVVEMSESTRPRAESLYRCHLEPYFGDTEIARINSKRAITAFKIHLKEQGVKRGSIRNILITLKAVLNWAYESDYLQVPPKNSWFEIPAGRLRKLKPLNFEQVEALASAQTSSQRRLFVLWSAYAGTRLGETRAVTWQDLNAAMSEVWVRQAWKGKTLEDYTKDKKDRHTKIRPMLRDRLHEYWLEQGRPTDGFIFARPDGRELDPDVLRQQYNRAKATVGLDAYTIHDLRHTACSLAHWGGAKVVDIMKDFGWADLQMLKRYLHSFEREDDPVDDQMSVQWRLEVGAGQPVDASEQGPPLTATGDAA